MFSGQKDDLKPVIPSNFATAAEQLVPWFAICSPRSQILSGPRRGFVTAMFFPSVTISLHFSLTQAKALT
jgi:hypothetical protein